MEIRLLGPQIGVEVRGVDVQTMDADSFGRIYQAWLDHNIMCVRGQDLTIPDFIRYSERFGPVTPHPSKSTRHPEHPKITFLGINKFDAEGKLRDEIYRRGAEGGPNPRTRRNRRGIPSTRRSPSSASTNSTPRANCATRSTGAAPRAGIPTAPTTRRRSRRRSFTRWRCRAAAATRCSPTA